MADTEQKKSADSVPTLFDDLQAVTDESFNRSAERVEQSRLDQSILVKRLREKLQSEPDILSCLRQELNEQKQNNQEAV